MVSGLLALLDDVAALAKVAAASLDDVAGQVVKASGKAAGVVIDDTAVTPRYVVGFAAEPLVAGQLDCLSSPSPASAAALCQIGFWLLRFAAEPYCPLSRSIGKATHWSAPRLRTQNRLTLIVSHE